MSATSSQSTAGATARDYGAISRLAAHSAQGDRQQRMRALVDTLWEALSPTGVAWLGFYLHDPGDALDLGATAKAPLVLGPHRDAPACSPIGLSGVCGQAFVAGATRIVRDVRELGGDYIACDPRDQSEIVIPLFEPAPEGERRCWGVLDVDSHAIGAFDERDEVGLTAALAAAGLLGSDAALA